MVQREIIPIGKDVYLHSLHRDLDEPLPQHHNASGDFIIYKSNKKNNRLFMCLYDPTLTTEANRNYVMTVNLDHHSRIIQYKKDVKYVTDKIEMLKVDELKVKDREIIAYGKWKLDIKVRYNLYGVQIDNKRGKLFHHIFVLSKYAEYFNSHDITTLHGGGK